MSEENQKRFDILSNLAASATDSSNIREYAQNALNLAAKFIGLEAASLYLWDADLNISMSISYIESDRLGEKLSDLESNLFRDLREQKNLYSAYMTFSGEPKIHSFTQPLHVGQDIFGAVIGLQSGEKSTTNEDKFIESICSILSLSIAVDQKKAETRGVSKNIIEKARLNAILETAVTVNHEVNNPLQAIIGNVQLLIMKTDENDNDIKDKLKAIEDSAMKISDVTKRLMQMTQAKTSDYTNGTQMIDISDKDDSSEKDE